jgi:hypothetical protein
MIDPSPLEKTAGSLPVKATANAIAVFGSTITPLAAFVPFLVDTLASGRQTERLERMFAELNALTAEHSERLKELSDDQYKVVNEAISAAFYTTEEAKLDLLKRAAANAVADADAVSGVSDALSRVVRDISAAEAAFVIRNFNCELLVVADGPTEMPRTLIDMPRTLGIKPHSTDEIILSGLINLGLLYSKTSRWGLVAFEWSPLVVKLIRLLKDV